MKKFFISMLSLIACNHIFSQNINIIDIDKECAIVKADSAYCLMLMTDSKPYSIPCAVFLGDDYCSTIQTILNISLIRQKMPAEDTYIIHDRFGDITLYNRNDTLYLEQIGSIGKSFIDRKRLDKIQTQINMH